MASASPRRKELLSQLVKKFDILPAKGEEVLRKGLTPKEQVCLLARNKAEEIAALPVAQGKAVLGADTIVVLDNEILGKPKDEQDAERMLLSLSGKVHEVYTGVCIAYPTENGVKSICEADCTRVHFERVSKAQIKAYIATGSPMDKAGAYGIQDGNLVRSIEGSMSNVIGLPIELCKRIMEQAGI